MTAAIQKKRQFNKKYVMSLNDILGSQKNPNCWAYVFAAIHLHPIMKACDQDDSPLMKQAENADPALLRKLFLYLLLNLSVVGYHDGIAASQENPSVQNFKKESGSNEPGLFYMVTTVGENVLEHAQLGIRTNRLASDNQLSKPCAWWNPWAGATGSVAPHLNFDHDSGQGNPLYSLLPFAEVTFLNPLTKTHKPFKPQKENPTNGGELTAGQYLAIIKTLLGYDFSDLTEHTQLLNWLDKNISSLDDGFAILVATALLATEKTSNEHIDLLQDMLASKGPSFYNGLCEHLTENHLMHVTSQLNAKRETYLATQLEETKQQRPDTIEATDVVTLLDTFSTSQELQSQLLRTLMWKAMHLCFSGGNLCQGFAQVFCAMAFSLNLYTDRATAEERATTRVCGIFKDINTPTETNTTSQGVALAS